MGILSSIGKGISKALDVISAPLSQPITFITQGPSAAAKKVAESRQAIATGQESGLKKIGTIALTTGVVATGVLAAGGATAAGSAGSVARSVVTSKAGATIGLGTAALAIAAPKTLQAIAKEPAVAKVAVAAAVNPALGIVAGVEQGVGLISTSLKENEGALKAAGVVAGTALLTGAGVYGVSKLLADDKKDVELPVVGTPTGSEVPLTPATKEVRANSSTTRKKRRSKPAKQPQNINNRINITFDNDVRDNKKYLKGVTVR